MKYLNKSFSVPVGCHDVPDDEWESIFGTEAERKEKMAKAIEEQKRKGKTPLPKRCRGGVGAGKVQG